MMRIVIVDDHLALAESLALGFGRHWRVTVLCDGQALIDWLRQHPVDVVLLDTTLPHCNIRHLIQRIRRECESVVIVMMSIHGRVADWPCLQRFGVHGVVSKCAKLVDLVADVERIRSMGQPNPEEAKRGR